MPVHDAIAVRVDARAHEFVAHELAGGIFVFKRADELGQHLQASLGVACVDAKSCVPVVVSGGRTLAWTGPRRASVDNEREPKDGHQGNDQRENGASLEANLFAFALLSELGDFFGG